MSNRTETLDHGYPIIAAKPSRDSGRVIVADRGEGAPHRYAIWHEYPNGVCEGGSYVHTLAEAARCFDGRA